jgi:biotin carboxyl carrier protein
MARRLALQVDGSIQDLDLTRGPDGTILVDVDGETRRVELVPDGAGGMHRLRVDGRLTDVHIERAGRGLRVTVGAKAHEVVVHRGAALNGSAFEEGELAVSAPMSGVVTEVLVEEGSVVRQGDPLLVIVAMKMNNEIRSPLDGVVRTVHVQVGELAEHGALLVVLEPAEESAD